MIGYLAFSLVNVIGVPIVLKAPAVEEESP